jgi:hypothetical protein
MRAAKAAAILAVTVAILGAPPAAAGVRRGTLPVTVTVVRRAEIALPRDGAATGATGRVPVVFVDGAPPSFVIVPRRTHRPHVAAEGGAERAPRT